MLRKLIIYDLKASYKVFLLFHLIYFVACIFAKLFFFDQIDFIKTPAEVFIVPLTLLLSVLSFLVAGVNIGAWLIIAFRFYKNLFSKQGYLTWTLPVSKATHLWAKLLSGYVLSCIDTLIIFLGFVVLLGGPNIREAYTLVEAEITEGLGMELGTFFLYMMIFNMLTNICSILTIYFCIAIGQLFPNHRVLWAIATYFIITFVLQVVTILFLLLTGSFTFYSTFEGSPTEQVFDILLPTLVVSLILSVAEYIATHYIMKRKIDII